MPNNHGFFCHRFSRPTYRFLDGLPLLALLHGCAMVCVSLHDCSEQDEVTKANPQEPHADAEAELDDALSRMIADLEQSLEAAAVEAKEDAVAEDGTYVVKNGDYLDKIINQTVGQSPLRRDILRSAFVRANPHAFMRSNPNWLLANKKLRVPDADDIKKVIFTDESRRNKNQRAGANPYEGWIQYP